MLLGRISQHRASPFAGFSALFLLSPFFLRKMMIRVYLQQGRVLFFFFFNLSSLGYTKYFRFEVFGSWGSSETGINNWNYLLCQCLFLLFSLPPKTHLIRQICFHCLLLVRFHTKPKECYSCLLLGLVQRQYCCRRLGIYIFVVTHRQIYWLNSHCRVLTLRSAKGAFRLTVLRANLSFGRLAPVHSVVWNCYGGITGWKSNLVHC